MVEDNKTLKPTYDKIEAKRIARKNGLPVIEGSEGEVKSYQDAKKICLINSLN